VGCAGQEAFACVEHRIRTQILEKNNDLAVQVQDGKISDLEALAQLAEYAATVSPDCAKCFVNNVGAVLTGISNGKSAETEIAAQLGQAKYDEYREDASKLGQSGYAPIFQDPDTSCQGS